MTTANNRRVIHLPALPPGMEVVIQRVGLRQVGLDAGMLLLNAMDLGRVAARNAAEGGALVQHVATTPPRPPEPPREDPVSPLDPAFRRRINLMVDRATVMAGLVSPSFEELCRMYGASQEEPERAMGPDWDVLLGEVARFSADGAVGHVGTRGSPAEQERFPDAARADPR